MLQHVKDSKGRSTGTKLEHLKSVQAMTKKTPSELILPELDVTVVHLLDCFYDVKTAAGEKITYNELKSYQQLMCVDLSAWQVEVIMTIDSIFEGSVHG